MNEEIQEALDEQEPAAPPERKPTLARRIRDFFETLFPDKLVLQLRDELNETRHERDYFKGRAERLELLLTQPRVANRDLSAPAGPGERPVHPLHVGGRKTWAQLVKERRVELADKAAKAEAAKTPAKTSAPVTPAQN